MPRRCRPLLGTFVEISAEREEAIEAGFEAIARVHRLMSAHDVSSDLSRINRFAHLGPVEVDEWTVQVLERARFWARESNGAFDPVRAGAVALGANLIPRHAHQPVPLDTSWTALEIEGQSVRLKREACIDLGGIAKGFAADRAVDAMKGARCSTGLVNCGGDLCAFGAEAWLVAIVDPLRRRPVAEVEVDDEALATSAGLPDGSGLSFDHLGGRNRRWASVTVLASSACDADAMTKLIWSGGDLQRTLLARIGAKALGITHSGDVEPIAAAERMVA
jgi:thiamine biosynthesis lipoprotein